MRDLLLYAVLAFLVIACGLVLVSYTNQPWTSFIFLTILFTAMLAKMYWPVRRVWRLWLLLAAFMAAHTAAYIVLLRHLPDWPALWYILTMPLEGMLFATIAWLWLKLNPRLSGRL